ncbi:MAG: nicotinate-nucleotide--dimethylbenzimidazole phosphoribosyltransferase [Myxococcota bacterium]
MVELPALTRLDRAAAQRMQAELEQKTKPPGSLGRLEALAVQLAAIRGSDLGHRLAKAVVVMGADHGVARHGVSAYPSDVTRQMLATMARGTAAISVLAAEFDADLRIVDMGVSGGPLESSAILDRRVAAGTEPFHLRAAMTEPQRDSAMQHGLELARTVVTAGADVVCVGEMGIGNTTSASAITALLTGHDPLVVVGRGTGVDDDGLHRKREVVGRAIELYGECADDPLAVLAAVGGFEIAGLVGLIFGLAAQRRLVVLDGFIAGAAGLVATRLAPGLTDYLVAAHRSAEAGAQVQLDALGLNPLLDLDLRLGEATGAALVLPILDAALAIARRMGTFTSSGVSRGQPA